MRIVARSGQGHRTACNPSCPRHVAVRYKVVVAVRARSEPACTEEPVIAHGCVKSAAKLHKHYRAAARAAAATLHRLQKVEVIADDVDQALWPQDARIALGFAGPDVD